MKEMDVERLKQMNSYAGLIKIVFSAMTMRCPHHLVLKMRFPNLVTFLCLLLIVTRKDLTQMSTKLETFLTISFLKYHIRG